MSTRGGAVLFPLFPVYNHLLGNKILVHKDWIFFQLYPVKSSTPQDESYFDLRYIF